MADRLIDDNGVIDFIDDNGVLCFVDDNGNYTCAVTPGDTSMICSVADRGGHGKAHRVRMV